jgi:hypothetical protein
MTLDYKQLKREFIEKQIRIDKMKAHERIKEAQQLAMMKRGKNESNNINGDAYNSNPLD